MSHSPNVKFQCKYNFRISIILTVLKHVILYFQVHGNIMNGNSDWFLAPHSYQFSSNFFCKMQLHSHFSRTIIFGHHQIIFATNICLIFMEFLFLSPFRTPKYYFSFLLSLVFIVSSTRVLLLKLVWYLRFHYS